MNIFKYPRIFEKSEQFNVSVNGQEVDVIHSCVADICVIISDKPVELEVTFKEKIIKEKTSISPKNIHKDFETNDDKLYVTANPGEKFVAFINDRYSMCPLFVSVYLPEEKPNEDDENVLFFKGGQVYELGLIQLQSNQTLYIEEGAIVRGRIYAEDCENIKICGRGVLDIGYFVYGKENCRGVLLKRTKNIEIKDVSIINPLSWMIQLHRCENVIVDNIIESGKVVSSDGVDIVASKNVTVTNCLLSNNDDCVVIKSFPIEGDIGPTPDVENILVEKNILLNGPAGNALEIGHELHSEYVKNIIFRDNDIVTCHDLGAAISIHNCDNAIVTDVLFENIRIEHFYEKLFDIRVMRSQFAHKAPGQGYIRNVKFKDIFVNFEDCNIGYSVSMISGFDTEHKVENIVFEDVYLNDDILTEPNLIEMCFRNCENIKFIDSKKNIENVIDFNK